MPSSWRWPKFHHDGALEVEDSPTLDAAYGDDAAFVVDVNRRAAELLARLHPRRLRRKPKEDRA